MKKYLLILSATIMMASCGGSGGLNKDSKADFQLGIAEAKGLGEADQAKYKDKVIEVKGFVKSPKAAKASSAPNKFFFYLGATAADESGMIIYTDQDITANAGKEVTVKGKFEYAGAVSLTNSAVY